MDMIRITRYTPEAAGKLEEISGEFLEPSTMFGKLVAVYSLEPIDKVSLYISEYSNGTFWTIAERDDTIGTLTHCIEFLLKYFGYDK